MVRLVVADVLLLVSQVAVASRADAPLVATLDVQADAVAAVPVALLVSQVAVANRAVAPLVATLDVQADAVAVVPVALLVSQAAVASRADVPLVATLDVQADAVAVVPVALLVSQVAVANLAVAPLVATLDVQVDAVAVAVAVAVRHVSQAVVAKPLAVAADVLLLAAVRRAVADAESLLRSRRNWLAVRNEVAANRRVAHPVDVLLLAVADVPLSQAAVARSSQRKRVIAIHRVRA